MAWVGRSRCAWGGHGEGGGNKSPCPEMGTPGSSPVARGGPCCQHRAGQGYGGYWGGWDPNGQHPPKPMAPPQTHGTQGSPRAPGGTHGPGTTMRRGRSQDTQWKWARSCLGGGKGLGEGGWHQGGRRGTGQGGGSPWGPAGNRLCFTSLALITARRTARGHIGAELRTSGRRIPVHTLTSPKNPSEALFGEHLIPQGHPHTAGS